VLPARDVGSTPDRFPQTGPSLRILAIILLLCGVNLGQSGDSIGQQVPPHLLFNSRTPPGIAGATRLARGGPVEGYYQTVEIRGPHGVQVSLVEAGQFGQPRNLPLTVGLLVGRVYRFKIINLPGAEGAELFPTLEILDRLYPPPGQERHFPIIVEIHPQDVAFALEGKFVTRVVYLEDPQRALPAGQANQEQPWFEVRADQDPLIDCRYFRSANGDSASGWEDSSPGRRIRSSFPLWFAIPGCLPAPSETTCRSPEGV
jgi:hypothetical protein